MTNLRFKLAKHFMHPIENPTTHRLASLCIFFLVCLLNIPHIQIGGGRRLRHPDTQSRIEFIYISSLSWLPANNSTQKQNS